MSRVILSIRLRGMLLAFMPLLILIFIGCSSNFVYPTFSHQGKLLDSSGNPVADGDYTVMYRLYHELSGTDPAVYTDTKTVTITDGYFDSYFGDTGVDPKIFSERTWLEITINGETLTPRQFLRGAPYASGLVAGSAAIGSKPVTYTYESLDNLGSAFFAANTNSTATGGSGLTGVTTAQLETPSTYKLDVAAVRGLAVNTDSDSSTGAYAGIFVSEDYRGLYADNGTGSSYAAYFAGNIYVSGSCVGCTTAQLAKNIGNNDIESGDFVTAIGVELDPDYNVPVLLVRKGNIGDTLIGVANSTLTRGDYQEGTLTQFGFDPASGPATPQAYVSIVTEGLVQARLSQETPLEIGTFVTAKGVQAEATLDTDNIAQVMSDQNENGLQWILLNR